MKKQFLIPLGMAALIVSACTTHQTNSENGMTLSNTEKVVALLNSIETGDQTAVG